MLVADGIGIVIGVVLGRRFHSGFLSGFQRWFSLFSGWWECTKYFTSG